MYSWTTSNAEIMIGSVIETSMFTVAFPSSRPGWRTLREKARLARCDSSFRITARAGEIHRTIDTARRDLAGVARRVPSEIPLSPLVRQTSARRFPCQLVPDTRIKRNFPARAGNFASTRDIDSPFDSFAHKISLSIIVGPMRLEYLYFLRRVYR